MGLSPALLPSIVVVAGSAGYLGQRICNTIRQTHTEVRVIEVDRRSADVNGDLRSQDFVKDVYSAIPTLSQQDTLGLVCAAGFSPVTPMQSRTREEFTETVEVNLLVPIWLLNHLLIFCGKNNIGASVVLIGSVYGSFAPDFNIYNYLPRRNSEVYGASKAGLLALTRYYAKHSGADGIRVNCVSPGGIFDSKIHTPRFVEAYGSRVAQKRLVEVDEVVNVILFMLSDKSSGITGQDIKVDAGFGL
jgi:NAD(P)-dependent dehydrogenase (short-subunit alcohol dehydrogenase family)